MAIIYRQRAGIRYSELSCAGCHRDFAASEDALNFYYDQAPALPCALRGGVRHTIHTCNDRRCRCHQYAAYQQRRARRQSKHAEVVP